MLCIHVSFQVLEVCILLVADLTDAELLGGGRLVGAKDDTLVSVELLRPREALVACVARVGTLAGMRPHVLLQRRRVDEPLGAHLTAERMLPAVTQHVQAEIARLVEPALADGARKRTDAGVFCHVIAQSVGARVRPTADVARVGPFAGMAAQVLLQVAELGE